MTHLWVDTYACVMFRKNIPYGIRVILRTRNRTKNEQRAITQKLASQESWFLRATHLWVDTYACVKFRKNIPYGIRVILRTGKCLRTRRRRRRRRRRRDDVKYIVSPDYRLGDTIKYDQIQFSQKLTFNYHLVVDNLSLPRDQ